MIGLFPKNPIDQMDYDIDFSRWLEDGDTITSVDVAVTPPGELTIPSSQISGPTVKVWTAGGLDGTTYEVSTAIGTSGGRVKEVCFKIRVRDC